MNLPVIAVTAGDGAGIGPEVIVKALHHPYTLTFCRPIVIGDAGRLAQAAQICGSPVTMNVISTPKEAQFAAGKIDVIDMGGIPRELPFGRVSAVAGEAAFQYVRMAAELSTSRQVDAMCTAPLNKEALHAAGHIYPGHTELLADLTGVDEVSMMLATDRIRVIHVTTHVGLLDAIEIIEPDLVLRTIQRGHEALVTAGIQDSRVAVCGINPHAGENGLFGRGEEGSKVIPAVTRARELGIDVQGPLPADTVFFRASRGDFDLVVAMYHDQGHAPIKILGLEAGVNITVGLPVIRTSVDHGTAFDIAGTGVADERSLVEALRQAAALAPERTSQS